MKLFHVTKIEYCFDSEEEKELNLPESMYVECDHEDEIADSISDQTGFLVNSYEYNEV